MKNLYFGITMLLLANHQSYYGITGLDFFKPYPFGDVTKVCLVLLKSLLCFSFTFALVKYSKIYRLINTEQPLSKVIIAASLAILLTSKPFEIISHSMLVMEIAEIAIFFTLLNLVVQKNYPSNQPSG